MRVAPSLLLLTLVVVLLVEAEAGRRWRRPFQREESAGLDRRGRRRGGHLRNNRWNDFWRDLGFHGRWGGRRHSFGYGGRDSPFNFGFSFDFGREPDWWEGPHVCRSEDVDNSTSSDVSTVTHHFKAATQVCEQSETAYRCTSTVQGPEGQITKVELFECCHGYSRKANDFGCPQELELKTLLQTARELDLNDLLTALDSSGLTDTLRNGNFTLFAPRDGGFPLDLGPGITLNSERDRNRPRALELSSTKVQQMEGELQDLLLSHLLPEPRRASSFSDEEVIPTGSRQGSSIRVNFYSRPQKMTTANCVPVVSSDHMATNGVIHTVDKALPLVTSSLLELVQRDEEFSYLKTALARAGLVSTLKGEGQFTLFAPTNSAFQKLDRALLDRLLSGDPECLQKVLKEHLLPNVICAEVIQGKAKSTNLLGNFLNLTRTEDNKVFANDAQVVRSDVMATNGVMHVIDSVIIPDDAKDLVSVAKAQGLTEFVKLVQAAGLTSTLQNADNVTVMAPSNDAIQALPQELAQKLTSDPALLESVLMYHVIPEELKCRQMFDNRLLDTLNAQGKVRVNEYSSFPFTHDYSQTVQCASIVKRNVAACNGIVQVIDKVLVPPTGNVVDVLAADSRYSTLVRLVKIAGLADALQEEGPFSVFAPTNQAFERLGRETLKELEGDIEHLASILKLHVFQGNLCCAGIFNSPWWRKQQLRTLNGETLFLSRDRSGAPLVEDAAIGSCDNMATNGVVHGIEAVLLPRPKDPWWMFH